MYSVFDVRTFGALGDGVTDVSTRIQNAINAAGNAGGGVVWVPVGSYVINTQLTMPTAKVEIRGAGFGAKFRNLTTSAMIAVTAADCAINDVLIDNESVSTAGFSVSSAASRFRSNARVVNSTTSTNNADGGYSPTQAELFSAYQGLVSQNFDRQIITNSSIMISQRAYFMLVPLRAGQIVTNIHLILAAAGVTMSLSKAGLYSTGGTRLGVSADQGTGWETTGTKTVPLTSAYTVPASGVYYVALLADGGTLPTPLRMGSTAAGSSQIGSFPASYAIQSSQTDLPASATLSVGASGAIGFWVGVS